MGRTCFLELSWSHTFANLSSYPIGIVMATCHNYGEGESKCKESVPVTKTV